MLCCHQYIPQVVWKDGSGNPLIYLSGIHAAGRHCCCVKAAMDDSHNHHAVCVFVRARGAENVKWLEVNRITNVLSVGECPFRTDKPKSKSSRPTKAASGDKESASETSESPAGEEEETEVEVEARGIAEEAENAAKSSGGEEPARVYPQHFKVTTQPKNLHYHHHR